MSKKDTAAKEEQKGPVSPYIDARREWNERYGSYIARAKNWRLATFGVIGICLVQSFGLVGLAMQSKIVPYVVTLDRLGAAVSVTRADQMQKMDEKVIKSLLARWTADVRGVVSDGTAQRQMIDRTYSMLSNGTRALSMVNEYYKNDPPTTRSATSAVSVEISSVIPITDKTWQVEWEETTRSTQGGITGKQRWKANLTIALNPPTTEAQIFKNPIGLYIVDLSWSQTL